MRTGQMPLDFKKNLREPLKLDYIDTMFQQGDKNANIIRIELMDGTKNADLSGMVVGGQINRGDNSRIQIEPNDGTIDGNVVTVTIPESWYNVSGSFVAFVRLTSENNYIKRTILRIAGYIEPQGDGPLVDPGHTLPSLDELLVQLEAMENATEACNAAAQTAQDAARLAEGWGDATAIAEHLEAGNLPTVSLTTNTEGNKQIAFGIPVPAITFDVRTGEPGTDVEMEQSGTVVAPKITLTIPRGDTGAVEGVDYYTGNPAALGTASPGTSNGVARGNHVHPLPTADQIKGFLVSCCSGGTYAAGANVVFSKDPTQYTYLLPRLNYVTGTLLKTSGSAGNRTIVASTINAGSSNMTITTLTLKETSVITEWEITAIQRAIISSTGTVYSNPETLAIAFEGLTLK
jgi:hypothetical protein